MNKRPKEIEEAMDFIDHCTFNHSNTAVNAWDTIYNYIKKIENNIQELMHEEQKRIDDGK